MEYLSRVLGIKVVSILFLSILNSPQGTPLELVAVADGRLHLLFTRMAGDIFRLQCAKS